MKPFVPSRGSRSTFYRRSLWPVDSSEEPIAREGFKEALADDAIARQVGLCHRCLISFALGAEALEADLFNGAPGAPRQLTCDLEFSPEQELEVLAEASELGVFDRDERGLRKVLEHSKDDAANADEGRDIHNVEGRVVGAVVVGHDRLDEPVHVPRMNNIQMAPIIRVLGLRLMWRDISPKKGRAK